MPTVLLLRHGRSTANAAGILAGRAAGVDLDAKGLEQADAFESVGGEIHTFQQFIELVFVLILHLELGD